MDADYTTTRKMTLGCLPPSSRLTRQLCCEHYREEREALHTTQGECAALQNVQLYTNDSRDWPDRNQQTRDTCVAFAVAHCVELIIDGRNDTAPANGTIEAMSPEFLYYQMQTDERLMGPDVPPGYEEGATRLSQARNVLLKTGLCREDYHPYRPNQDGLVGDEPDDEAYKDAETHRFDIESYHIMREGSRRPGCLTELFHQCLLRGLPIAIGLPVFQEPTGLMNFETPLAEQTGKVYGPTDRGGQNLVLERSKNRPGHAVCVTGFSPHEPGSSEGWFTIRNSVGRAFGSDHPYGEGFGYLSSRYIDDYCWEYYVPNLR